MNSHDPTEAARLAPRSFLFLRPALIAIGLALATVTVASAAPAIEPPSADPAPEAKKKDKPQRRAGLRFGSWGVDDPGAGADVSDTPTFEGYFERDLDVRLSIESTVGVWRRTVERTTGGIGGSSTERAEGYVVPIFTTLKFYPVRHDRRRISPYLSAGIGVALGMEKVETTGGVPGAGDGSSTRTGYGYNAGAGMDWSFGRTLGLSFTARYQNLRLDQAMTGDQYFKGYVVAAGATYRFQHD